MRVPAAVFSVVGLALLAACATESQSSTVAAAEGEELICRSIPRPNSRFSDRVCATAEEWEAADEAAAEGAEEFMRRDAQGQSQNDTSTNPFSSSDF